VPKLHRLEAAGRAAIDYAIATQSISMSNGPVHSGTHAKMRAGATEAHQRLAKNAVGIEYGRPSTG
jgi:hypothetical protein